MTFSEQELAGMCAQMARGLEYLADQGVLHRDLAARNVLLDAANNCKLTDFGHARAVSDEGVYQVHSAVAVRWAAPEVLSEQEATVASDIYSLGVTMWECFSRAAEPFAEQQTHAGVIVCVTQGKRPPRPSAMTNDALWDLVQAAWAAGPEARPTAGEVAERLEAILDFPNAMSRPRQRTGTDAGFRPVNPRRRTIDPLDKLVESVGACDDVKHAETAPALLADAEAALNRSMHGHVALAPAQYKKTPSGVGESQYTGIATGPVDRSDATVTDTRGAGLAVRSGESYYAGIAITPADAVPMHYSGIVTETGEPLPPRSAVAGLALNTDFSSDSSSSSASTSFSSAYVSSSSS
jgi:serine/threonine protein kinase